MRHPINASLTWYDATANQGDSFDCLSGSRDVDSCVVGGGFAGLTTALELARAGKSVVLLEADRIANGASGRNGGFVSSGFSEGFEAIAKTVGLDGARSLHAQSREGREYVREIIARHDPSIKMGDGMVVMQRHGDDEGLRKHGERMNANAGEDLVFLRAAELGAHVETPVYKAGLFSPSAFHIHPLRYAMLLAKLAKAAGAEVFEMSAALTVERAGNGFNVVCATGTVKAKQVVYCVSSLDPKLLPEVGRALLPIATYIAVTAPLKQAHPVRSTVALADTRRAGNYFRKLPDGRLLWGAHITTRVSQPANLAARMQGDIVSVFPQLRDVRIDYHWAGLMGYALHKMPLIGTDGQGQWFATGFGGHGLNTTAMAGNLVAHAISAGDDRFRQFAAFGPKWAFGPVGRIGVQASYWWMQLKDRLDERKVL
jgi:gamma-glutamylputrescine oxidase